ncbi:hypothetical protein [Aurantivibrio infirmus]
MSAEPAEIVLGKIGDTLAQKDLIAFSPVVAEPKLSLNSKLNPFAGCGLRSIPDKSWSKTDNVLRGGMTKVMPIVVDAVAVLRDVKEDFLSSIVGAEYEPAA